MTTLKDRVVLITGASRGIGFWSAIEAARRGAQVIGLARTTGGLEELDDAIQKAGGLRPTLMPFNLAETAAIDQIGLELYKRWGRLDGLIGNAAILGDLTPVHHILPERWDEIVAINLTANYRLIRTCDPLLRRGEKARAVFLTSGAAYSQNPYWGMYAATKAGLNSLVQAYASEIARTQIRVNLFSPGATRTAMRALAMPGEDPEILPSPSKVANCLVDLIEPTVRANGQIFKFQTARCADLNNTKGTPKGA